MYQPEKYKKDELSFAKKMIHRYPFATVVLKNEEFFATHIPVLLEEAEEDLILFAHIANHNPMRKYLQDGENLLLIFKGADAYISSSWYKDKNISTWDYSAVHIQANVQLQSETELKESLKKLISRFEKHEKNPVFYEDIPIQMLSENLQQITGFWCRPISVKGVGKWHQAFEKEDVESVINHLQQKKCPLSTELAADIKKEHDL